MPLRLSYSAVVISFEEKNCKLLSENYFNAIQKLRYICTCNHQRISTFTYFQQLQTPVLCTKCVLKQKQNNQNTYSKYEFQKMCNIMETLYGRTHKYRNCK